MSAIEAGIRFPVHGDGFIQLSITIDDLAALTDRDRSFIIHIFDQMAELCPAPPEVPAVLRGLVGSKP